MAEAALHVTTDPLPELYDIPVLHENYEADHWFNYVWQIPDSNTAFNVLNVGVPIMDLLRRPIPAVERLEWLAFNLHNLIDRVSIFYDFVKLRCNDGRRRISFTQPLFYGSDITFAGATQGVRDLINTENPKCSHRLKVGREECFAVNSELLQDFSDLNLSVKVPDGALTNDGASTYIETMLNKLKEIRENPDIFLCRLDTRLPTTFEAVAKYMMFHLIAIMSHITACHFKWVTTQKLNRHLFTLNFLIFSIGVHFDVMPDAPHVSTEFILLCRHLRHVDSQLERPVAPLVQAIPVEGAPQLPDEEESNNNTPGEAVAERIMEDMSPREANNRSNNVENTDTTSEVDNNNSIVENISLGEDIGIVPKTTGKKPELQLVRKPIIRTNCSFDTSMSRQPRTQSRNRKRKKE